MRRLILIAALCLAALSITSFAAAAGGKLKCFAGGGATCTLNTGSTSAHLVVPSGAFAGVYVSNGKSMGGTPLANADFSFGFNCADPNTNCLAGGSPRWSIPINNGTSPTPYAFIDALGCGYTSGGANNSIETVSTTMSNCKVFFTGDGIQYTNWDAFAAANPTLTIANALPFVEADQPFSGNIFDLSITKS